MFKNVMIPVRMKKVKDPSGREVLKSTVPMNLMFENDFDAKWLEEELIRFEKRYFALVKDLKDLLQVLRSKKQKNKRVLLYWKFGYRIVRFIEQDKNNPLFVESLTKSLVRDVEVSDKIIMRCKRFRLLYSDVTKIDSNRSFDSYVATFEGGYIPKSRRRKGEK
ncbi:hypothetical protein ES703_125017 [subsurface metagenome]